MKPIELPLSLRVASSPPEHYAPVKRAAPKEPAAAFPWDIIAGEKQPRDAQDFTLTRDHAVNDASLGLAAILAILIALLLAALLSQGRPAAAPAPSCGCGAPAPVYAAPSCAAPVAMCH